MRKFRRAAAAVITLLMVFSMLSVMSFADIKAFADDYVDPTGTISNSAYLVTKAVSTYKAGSQFQADWDGERYSFTVGYNVFDSIESAVEAADSDARVDRIQILLGNGSHGEVSVSQSMDVFGVNWNNNPSVVDPTDPTKPWAMNPDWSTNNSEVTDVTITAGASDVVNVWGVTITGRIYDNNRPVSAAKTTVTFKNINFAQTAAGVANFHARFNKYAISLWNANAGNTGESARNNIDETYFINFRMTNLAGDCTRLIDENVSPKLFFQGCYFDHSASGWTDVAIWAKWKDYMTNCNITFDGCFFCNFSKSQCDWQIESYEKKAVGCGGEDQYAECNVINNIFYDSAESKLPIAIYAAGFSEIHVDNNIAISTSPTGNTDFVEWWGSHSGTDFSDRCTMRDNTLIGFAGYNVTFGNSQNCIDTTGTYILAEYVADWRDSTSTLLPTGKVRYDYCYSNGARTKRTTDIPDFTVNGKEPDKETMSLAFDVKTGTQQLDFELEGIDYCEVYESDAEFSNYDDISKSKKLDACYTKDLNNYFIFLAYSLDLNNYDKYRLTVTKADPGVGELSFVYVEPEDAVVTSKELHVNVQLGRDADEFSFMLDPSLIINSYESSTGTITYDSSRIYTVKDIELGVTAIVHFEIVAKRTTEHFYVYIDRELSSDTTLAGVSEGVAFEDGKLSATLSGSADELTFTPSLPEGATAYVWMGTMTFAADADGSIKISEIPGGVSNYTLAVIAENGVDYKLYDFTVTRPFSDEAELLAVRGAAKTDSGFKLTVIGSYTVSATVSDGATYQVYTDKEATKPAENNTINVTADTTVYIVVTSESGKVKSKPVALAITKGELAGGSGDTPTPPATVSFKDVVAGSFYEEAVKWAVSKDVTSGTGEGTFSPSNNCTRGQVVTFLWRAAGSPEPSSASNPFTDVKDSAYYYKAVLWAVEKNVTNGLTATTFGPGASCNRGQVVTFLWRAKGSPKPSATSSPFTDVNTGGFYYDAMLWAVEKGITNGTTATTFGPAAVCTRAQVVTFLYRAFK